MGRVDLTIQTYAELIAKHFESRPINLGVEYVWPRGKNAVPYQETFQRRLAKSDDFISKPNCRPKIALDVVQTWGGIRGGNDETIRQMSQESPEQLIGRGTTRVASWSKILALHDPCKFFIYDARVAFALNHIISTSTSDADHFPMLPTRNNKIRKAIQTLRSKGVRYGQPKTVEPFYRTYIDVVDAVSEKLQILAWQIEMALFARGPVFASEITTDQ
jgi:hypothetical protein